VLLANLEPMAQVGMSHVLTEGGIDVVGSAGSEETEGVVALVLRLHPDAIVVGYDGRQALDLSDRVRAAAPGTKVILWARDESAMQVFDPGSAEPRQIRIDVPAALLGELSENKPTLRRE
jgi:DNA-binding NarL/FixJ family response regulator